QRMIRRSGRAVSISDAAELAVVDALDILEPGAEPFNLVVELEPRRLLDRLTEGHPRVVVVVLRAAGVVHAVVGRLGPPDQLVAPGAIGRRGRPPAGRLPQFAPPVRDRHASRPTRGPFPRAFYTRGLHGAALTRAARAREPRTTSDHKPKRGRTTCRS